MSETNQQPDQKSSEKLKTDIQQLQSQLDEVEALERQKLKPEETIKTIYKWQGPDRIVTHHSNLYYSVISVLFIIGIAIAILTEEYIFMVALVAVMALIYISDKVKPGLLKHEITNRGLKTGNKIYSWSIISGFFIAEKNDRYQLVVDIDLEDVPNRLIIPIGTGDPRKIVGLISEHSRYLLRKEIGLDFINIFTIGSYVEVSRWIEGDSEESGPEIVE